MSDGAWQVGGLSERQQEITFRQRLAERLRREHRIPLPWKVGAWLLIAYATVGTIDYHVLHGMEAERIERELDADFPLIDPLAPPRCPRVNSDGATLQRETAVQADGREWTYACDYSTRT